MYNSTTIKVLALSLLAVSTMILPSCVKNDVDDSAALQSNVGFKTSVRVSDSWTAVTKGSFVLTDIDSVNIEETVSALGGESIDTKGVRVDALSSYGSFGTFAYTYGASSRWEDVGSNLTPNFMYNLKSTQNGTNWSPSDRDYYWPAPSYRLSFFGYAPFTDYTYPDGTSISAYMSISESETKGAPVITYTVPTDITKQVDMLAADSLDVPGSFHNVVPMNFNHVLSGIRFTAKTKGDVIVVKNVEMKNVYDNGTYAIGASAWTLNSTKADYEFPTTHTVSTSSVEINDKNDSVFFMLPQILPSGAQLVVTYMINGTEETATADFSGKTWVMGKLYTYNLTIDASNISYTFTVTPISEPDAETVLYKVTSTKTIDYGGGYKITWNVDYTVDDSTFPTGATYTKNTDGTLTVKWAGREVRDSVMISGSALAMRNVDSLPGPIDLTTGAEYSGTRGETANCYVINGAGYYCFPCNVMGNGNAGIIPSDDDHSINGSGVFIDYNNKVLESSTSITIQSGDKAVLLWEDAKGLINDLKLGAVGTNYISFKTMRQSAMMPGNAVIALETSAGVIKWSWHIWCTLATGLYHFTSPITGRDSTFSTLGMAMHDDAGVTFNSKKYSFSADGGHFYGFEYIRDYSLNTPTSVSTKIMAVNLGAVERNRHYKYYKARAFDFTCAQEESGNTSAVNFGQAMITAIVTPAGYSNPLYQWGRKDPFISGHISTYVSDNTSMYYNASHSSGTNVFTISGSSTGNEANGEFGTYPVQRNSPAYYVNSWNAANYAVNLKFAIQHPMTFIYNTKSLTNYQTYNNKGFYDTTDRIYYNTTPVDWFTYKVDISGNNNSSESGPLKLSQRYDNAFLWGGGYFWHDYYVASQKTIYDPSPAGYKVAVGYAYSTVTSDGTYNYGNTTSYPTGLFFPATGMRNSVTGTLDKMGVRGDFWCSSLRYVMGGNDNGCYFKSANGEFGHQYADDEVFRGEALSLRPVGDAY